MGSSRSSCAGGVEPFQSQPKLDGEPEIGAGVAGRVGGAVVPLDQALSVGVGAIHLGGRGGRQEEDLGGDRPRASVSPLFTSGLSVQNVAVSVSYRSLTTSQSSLARACRWNDAFWPPTAGFWPIAMKP